MNSGYGYISNLRGSQGGADNGQPTRVWAAPYMGTNWVPTSIASIALRSGGASLSGFGGLGAAAECMGTAL